jgi:hypothetical protein
MSTIDPNIEQTTDLKAALEDVASRARRDGRFLDHGVIQAAIAQIDEPRRVAIAEAVTNGQRKRGRPRAPATPASVADLAGGK